MDNVVDIKGARLNNNRQVKIAYASSRRAYKWTNAQMYLTELIDRLKTPIRTNESLEHYMKLSKAKQDELKDVGGFVGGELKDGLRRAKSVMGRDLIALDFDNIPPGETDAVLKKLNSLECFFIVYSTRKHSSYAPRLRILFPLDRTVTADEYEPIARYLANVLGMHMADPTTFQASRLMYWPSCSADSEYVFHYSDKPFISADGILGTYTDWRNVAEWPRHEGEDLNINRMVARQQDPLTKEGLVGAFCKIYPISKVIEKYLSDVYAPTDVGDRWSYAEGSTSGGAIVYDDKFLYSHHATDPASNILCNAFDLVRVHYFESEDIEAKPNTPVHKLPSFKSMMEFASKDADVKHLIAKEEFTAVRESVEKETGTAEVSEEDISWFQDLKRRNTDGAIESSRPNIMLILENEPALKGRIVYDEFANRLLVVGALPWDIGQFETRDWMDQDDAQLRVFFETHYGISGKDKIADGLISYAYNNTINAPRDYLMELKWDGVKRVERLFIDYLGAEDNIYTRATAKKMLTAAVGRAIIGGSKFDQMCVLVGPQGIGKSTLLAKLAGEWFNDSLHSFEGKEASELIQGAWIIEVAELSAMNRSESNTVKQFLSKSQDIFRKAYGKATGRYPRRCVFFGTSNDSEFLRDPTGNRRFWPVDVGEFEPVKSVFKDLDRERDQIWAEAMNYYRIGEPLILNEEEEEIANKNRELHRESNAKEGYIKEFLDKKVTTDWQSLTLNQRMMFYAGQAEGKELTERDRICALEVWCECFGGDPKFMKRGDSIEINKALDSLKGWERMKATGRFGYCGVQRGFEKLNFNK